MGFSTWAKCKLEENWHASLFEAIKKVEGFLDVGWDEKSGFKKEKQIPSQRGMPWKGMESKAKHLKMGKIQTISRFRFQTQKKFH